MVDTPAFSPPTARRSPSPRHWPREPADRPPPRGSESVEPRSGLPHEHRADPVALEFPGDVEIVDQESPSGDRGRRTRRRIRPASCPRRRAGRADRQEDARASRARRAGAHRAGLRRGRHRGRSPESSRAAPRVEFAMAPASDGFASHNRSSNRSRLLLLRPSAAAEVPRPALRSGRSARRRPPAAAA